MTLADELRIVRRAGVSGWICGMQYSATHTVHLSFTETAPVAGDEAGDASTEEEDAEHVLWRRRQGEAPKDIEVEDDEAADPGGEEPEGGGPGTGQRSSPSRVSEAG